MNCDVDYSIIWNPGRFGEYHKSSRQKMECAGFKNYVRQLVTDHFQQCVGSNCLDQQQLDDSLYFKDIIVKRSFKERDVELSFSKLLPREFLALMTCIEHPLKDVQTPDGLQYCLGRLRGNAFKPKI